MAPAVQDVHAETTSVMFVDPSIAAVQVKGGKMKAIAVSTQERLAAFPDVHWIQQQGVPDYDVYAWQGMIAPANTPQPVIVESALRRALKDAEVVKRLVTAGVEPFSATRAEFAELIRKYRALWHPLIRDFNMSLD
jgi:tripartite-type tricarboxylate transporter receptor subunit TctC